MVLALCVAVIGLAALYADMRLRWRATEAERDVYRRIVLARRPEPQPVLLPFVRPVRAADAEAPLESVR